mmetsp:Transcript_20310/g.32510  ORF Transcript_20310/g.32510 Transcript_20310/m.32510 type:complete len:244 (-) Transcript_20310:1657-2388(-)
MLQTRTTFHATAIECAMLLFVDIRLPDLDRKVIGKHLFMLVHILLIPNLNHGRLLQLPRILDGRLQIAILNRLAQLGDNARAVLGARILDKRELDAARDQVAQVHLDHTRRHIDHRRQRVQNVRRAMNQAMAHLINLVRLEDEEVRPRKVLVQHQLAHWHWRVAIRHNMRNAHAEGNKRRRQRKIDALVVGVIDGRPFHIIQQLQRKLRDVAKQDLRRQPRQVVLDQMAVDETHIEQCRAKQV